MDEDVDAEQLQRQLDQIKSAMGLHERYPGQVKLWLVFGAAVTVAAAISQYVVLSDLPGFSHAAVWFLAMGGAWGVSYVVLDVGDGGERAGNEPSIPFQYLAVFAFYVVAVSVTTSVPEGQYAPEAEILAMIVGLVGVSYLVVGNTLKAYYIRDRDRYAFYVGGAWMIALGAAIPLVDPLRKYGFAAFGALYGLHSIVSYLYLTRSQ